MTVGARMIHDFLGKQQYCMITDIKKSSNGETEEGERRIDVTAAQFASCRGLVIHQYCNSFQ